MVFNIEYKIDPETEKETENYKDIVINTFAKQFFSQLQDKLNFKIEKVKRIEKVNKEEKEIEVYSCSIDFPVIRNQKTNHPEITRCEKHVYDSTAKSKEKE